MTSKNVAQARREGPMDRSTASARDLHIIRGHTPACAHTGDTTGCPAPHWVPEPLSPEDVDDLRTGLPETDETIHRLIATIAAAEDRARAAERDACAAICDRAAAAMALADPVSLAVAIRARGQR